MFKICKKKIVLFKREYNRSWTNMTTDRFELKKKIMQMHTNPGPIHKRTDQGHETVVTIVPPPKKYALLTTDDSAGTGRVSRNVFRKGAIFKNYKIINVSII